MFIKHTCACLLSILVGFGCLPCLAAMQQSTDVDHNLLTVAEESGFKATSRSFEVEEFLAACAKQSKNVSTFVYGKTTEGKKMVAAVCANRPYEIGKTDDRNVALIIGNIHSGECCGKEALMMMLREIVKDKDHRWLKNNVLVFAPNYNADGNDKVGVNNRPGQLGPEKGMGKRETVKGFDLNRDFIKLDTSEGTAMVGLIDRLNPHLFIDCHTTNGSRHRYQLTYDIPHNPSSPAAVRTMMRNKMMPEITKKMAGNGLNAFYYGNLNRGKTHWTTYGYEPRYSTEYVGMRGRLSILSEAYSYISYKDRITVTKAFVTECLDYFDKNGKEIRTLLDKTQNDWISATKGMSDNVQLPMSAKVVAFDKSFPILGYKDGKPHVYDVLFLGDYKGADLANVPYAYVLDKKHAKIAKHLKKHGIEVKTLAADWSGTLQQSVVTKIDRKRFAFQQHKMVHLESKLVTVKTELKAGSFIIFTSQPLGRLASYVLEANSSDGLVTWNFFDADLKQGEAFPVLRLEKPATLPVR